MGVLRAAFVYFLIVFGAGFVLALVRIPFLVPRFGVRTAELMEMPVMLAVIAWASWRLARGTPALSRAGRLAAGLLALCFLVITEVALGYALGARSPGAYLEGRDPVSGLAYLASLVVFGLAPALWTARRDRGHSKSADA